MKKVWLWGVVGFVLIAGFLLWRPQLFIPLEIRLTSPDDFLRNHAFKKLGKLVLEKRKKLIPGLMRQTKDKNWRTRLYAIYILRKISPSSPDYFEIGLNALKDNNKKVRKEGVISLLSRGPLVVPYIVRHLDGVEKSTREKIYRGLQYYGADMVPVLLDGMGDPSNSVRKHSMAILRELGPRAGAAKKGLGDLLKSKNTGIRRDAALAVCRIEPKTEEAISILLEIIKGAEWIDKKFEAVKHLEAMGTMAAASVTVLNDELKRARDGVLDKLTPRAAVARALAKTDPRPKELYSLEWGLKNKDPLIRYRSAFVLSDLNLPPEGAVPMLVRSLDDTDIFVQARALLALDKIGMENMKRYHSAIGKKIGKTAKQLSGASEVEGHLGLIKNIQEQLNKN